MMTHKIKNSSLLAAVLMLIATTGFSQTTALKHADTWEGQQQSQAWATQKLAKSPRHSQWVQVTNGSRTLKAFVIYPANQAKVPVVIVLHEVFGLTDATRNTADEIAAMGYIAIVPDMLSGRGPNGGDVQSFANSRITSNALTGLSDEAVNADINAWADYGSKLSYSNGKFAVVGLSWGGGAAFRYVVSERKDLKAVFVFYDAGPTAQTINKINVPVYGFYGSTDSRVMLSLDSTKAMMSASQKSYYPVIYQGADHAFMRVGEDTANKNQENVTANKESLERLHKMLNLSFAY